LADFWFFSRECLLAVPRPGEALNIVWFKRDLRIHDHAPLVEAAKRGPVIALYIVEPMFWKLPDSSRRHWHFIHDSLNDLREALIKLGAKLTIRTGDAVEVFEELRGELGVFCLWSHEETGNGWTYARDLAVLEWARAHGITWTETPSNGVVRRLGNRDGWAAIRDARMAMPAHAVPAIALREIASQDLPGKDHPMFGDGNIGHVQGGGRTEGQKVLTSFLKERACNYMTTISKPGISARHCSRLSAHIAYGTLSSREVEQATVSKMKALSGIPDDDARYLRKNLSAFLSRLAWRCHFVQKMEQQPSIEFTCMHRAFEGMREPHFRENFFNAWANGQTGYPLVDACMRSLHANGWITFRMRAMLVSFASYHLWLDWRKTAPHLARLFTDYEPGVHYSQFQMQSGVTGINAVRMYNPIKQSMDHDPEGRFIRRYVPELKDVSAQWIHEPWRMPEVPAGYPHPLVDHDEAIKRARAEISLRWKSQGFSDDARAIRLKLGSRATQLARSKRVDKRLGVQLSFDV
jgi:deoxyribodipyrimidine photo-lyase